MRFSSTARRSRKALLCIILACQWYSSPTSRAIAQPALTMAHFPVFRRELMQSHIDQAYGEIDRHWDAPVKQIVLNSYCDSWRALHAKTYAVQGIPAHWLTQATQLGYQLLVGITNEDAYTLLLTRAKTNEQLRSLLHQQRIATPDRLAGITGVGKRYLETELGIDGKHIRLATMSNDDMPVLELLKGGYQAALTSPNVYASMPAALKQDIRVISIPSPPVRAVLVADPKQLNDERIARLRALLLTINSKSAPHRVHYLSPEALAKIDRNEPAIDSSQCPLSQ